MKQAIRIDDKTNDKPIEMTHCLNNGLWQEVQTNNWKEVDKVIYLGNSINDGDMFAVYDGGDLFIYKGYLNSGKY